MQNRYGIMKIVIQVCRYFINKLNPHKNEDQCQLFEKVSNL